LEVASSNHDEYTIQNRTAPWNESTVKNSSDTAKDGNETPGICTVRVVKMMI
jgi:hypothetical protein